MGRITYFQAALLAGAGLVLTGCSTKEETQPKPVVAVKVAKAETAQVKVAVRAPATVFAREQANVAARITAPIRALKAHKGDDVKAGQILAELENKDVVAQHREAEAALIDAQANLERTSGGTLPTDVERARGQLETSDAALQLATKVYERRATLFKQGAIPQRDLLQSETELMQAKTNAAVSRKSLQLLQQQSGTKDIAIARSRVEQARARLAQSAAQLEFTEMRAPFAGTVTEQFMYGGDMAKPDAPTFTVMDLSVVTARAQVPEAQIGAVRAGQACEFAPVDQPAATFAGRVTVVNKAVDPQRRTVEVWCEIPNAGRKLRAAVFGEARIATGAAQGVVVPLAAVQFNEGTRTGFVMTVDEKKIAHKREIEAAEPQGETAQILKGLNPGESVIVEGHYGLPDGTEVTLAGAAGK